MPKIKITEIRIDRTKSLGNYENVKLGLTAVVGEDEDPAKAIDNVTMLLDWQINKDDRERERQRFTARLAELESVKTVDAEVEKAKINKWLDKYHERKDATAALAE